MRRIATEKSSVSDNKNLTRLFNSVHCFQNTTIRRWITYYIPIFILEVFWCLIALPPLMFSYPVNECSQNGIDFTNSTCTEFRFNSTIHQESECIPYYAIPITANYNLFILGIAFLFLMVLNLAILILTGNLLFNYHEFSRMAVIKYRVILKLKPKKRRTIIFYLIIILMLLILAFIFQSLGIILITQTVFETTCMGVNVYYTIAMNNTNKLDLFISLLALVSYAKGSFILITPHYLNNLF